MYGVYRPLFIWYHIWKHGLINWYIGLHNIIVIALFDRLHILNQIARVIKFNLQIGSFWCRTLIIEILSNFKNFRKLQNLKNAWNFVNFLSHTYGVPFYIIIRFGKTTNGRTNKYKTTPLTIKLFKCTLWDFQKYI